MIDQNAIEARGAAKVFPSGDGVSDLDVSIPAGTIFGFIGPSGSGKTTAVRMLTGAVRPTAGTVEVLGEDPSSFDTETRSRIGYMPQISVLYPEMTVSQNLRFFSSLYGVRGRQGKRSRRSALEFVELAEHANKRVDAISGGMQRRLSIAAALAHDPHLMFLDEPTAGIDPVLRRTVWEHFTELRDHGRTLFITTQYVGEAAYCDQVGLLSEGELIHVGTPTELRRKAAGGDIVRLEVSRTVDRATVEREIGDGSSSAFEWIGPGQLEIVVEDAGTAIPIITTNLQDADVPVSQIEEYVPTFDDVFVKLVEQHRSNADVSEVGVSS